MSLELLNRPWPANVPRVFRPIAHFKLTGPRLDRGPLDPVTDDEVADAIRLCPKHFGFSSWAEIAQANNAAFTANANTNVETSLLVGSKLQPEIYVPNLSKVLVRCMTLEFSGIIGSTAAPTSTFFVRASTTQGVATLSGTVLGQSAAITLATTVTTKTFWGQLDMQLFTPGEGSGNATLSCCGYISSPNGFTTPFAYPLTPGGGDSATLTATLDGSQTYYLNFSNTWSAAAAANTATLQNLRFKVWN